ncbi:uncharacterized protein [Henckelia pumila]|uniref:uncharacterized protein isoform X1 n=1 Tax=Henckelia pumila TaxID=405737 RepID=UPI003C6E1011
MRVKLLFAGAEPKKVTSPTITNIDQHRTSKLRRVHGFSHQSSYPHVNGWLQGLRAYCDSNQLPTIVVVASYDTFGAAPALSVGSDSNGSGIVALLEIARLFSALYKNTKTRGRYNLHFVLKSGGPYNYNGTQNLPFLHKSLTILHTRMPRVLPDFDLTLIFFSGYGVWTKGCVKLLTMLFA